MNLFARVLRTLAVAGVVGTVVPAGLTVVATTFSSEAYAQSISVRGNRRVDVETIRAYFTPRPGEAGLTQVRVDEGVKGLLQTGLFSDVRATRTGGGVIVTVVEAEILNNVVFEGNKRVKTELLTAEVESKPRGPFSRSVIQADVQRIVDLYRRVGRYDVRVEPKYINRDNGRVDLVFEIQEGERSPVTKIVFVGNRAYGDSRLRDQMTTAEKGIFSFFKNNDNYDADRLAADQELLRRFYLRNGYADFRVVSANAELDPVAHAFTITIVVDEGERYSFGSVDLVSNVADIDASAYRSLLRPSPGGVYNAELMDKTVEAVSIELARRGRPFATVRPRGERDGASRIVNIVFVIEEGPRVYVERINIRGNTRTRDYVIRREFDIAEGDAYNRALLDRGERRLKNLNFFKNVRVTNEPGSAPDRVIVNIDVEDQPTGEFSVAGGYSTQDGFVGEVSVGERNFLGRGQQVRLAVTLGQRTRGVEFSFTEPYFLGYRISAGFDLFAKRQQASNYITFDSQMIGGTVRFGIPITEEFGIQTRYSLYQQKITIPDSLKNCAVYPIPVGDPCLLDGEASYAYKELDGQRRLVSMVGYSLIYNTLDNNINPTSGILAEFRQDFAGVGGDAKFIRTTVDARWYRDLGFYDAIAFIRGQAGYIHALGGANLKILDQFFKGPDIVRGFAPGGIGPRDIGSQSLDSLGGTTYWGVTLEAQFPMSFLPKDLGLRGAVFADAGSLFNYKASNPVPIIGVPGGVPLNIWDDNTVRSSVGVGVLWASPFGPVRFDFAWPITKGQFDRTQWFRFSGGTRF